MRIGHGYDVHRFSSGGKLVLGGVCIPHSRGLAAHSDGDAVSHALCDALLGAAALGDLGTHFPDNDPAFKGMNSLCLLKQVAALLRERGFAIVNADVTILAETPKLAPHVAAMREALANILNMETQAISVKATTTEGLDAIGRGEGIAAHAVALLQELR